MRSLMGQFEGVSIRSPDRSQGRQPRAINHDGTYGFQSAPLTGARGDVPPSTRISAYGLFQSAPLTGARGDSRLAAIFTAVRCFNPLP